MNTQADNKTTTSPAGSTGFLVNRSVARSLREIGDILRAQHADPFRVNAYRQAAAAVEQLDVDLAQIVYTQGIDGLMALPHVGRGLSSVIEEIVRTGRCSRLDRIRGDADPEQLLASVPGIGPGLARRIHDELDVDRLEALEVAAFDGRLEQLSGFGPRRVQGIRAGLASLLDRPHPPASHGARPSVAELLDIDREYRKSAAAGTLPKITPRRFNPERRRWLAVLHRDLNGWHFTALFSNTARAHALARTSDWVVVYFYNHDHSEGQHTIVTERSGDMKNKRVVRGRELECASYYAQADAEVTDLGGL